MSPEKYADLMKFVDKLEARERDKSARAYFHVPFCRKNSAKRLGMRWDADCMQWYALRGSKAEAIATVKFRPPAWQSDCC